MKELLSLQITIFLLILIGAVIKKTGLVGDQGQKNLNDLVIYLILPCNIVKAFIMKLEMSMITDIVVMLVLASLIQVIFYFYGRLLYGKKPDGQKQCLQYATFCSNAGFLGNPIAEGIYGSYGLMLASIFLIPLRILMWTEGLAAFSGETDIKKTIRTVLTHPCIIACEIGLVLLLTGWTLPEPILKTVQYIGNCNTAFSLMIIGMILASMKVRDFLDGTALMYSVHRLILLPLIVFAIIYLLQIAGLPISDTTRGVAVILSGMPAGATTSILAAKYGKEPEFATKLVVTSTVLSIPTICMWSIILA